MVLLPQPAMARCWARSMCNVVQFRPTGARPVTFDRHYAGSLPCMPARRDMLTRNWGPLEPFDNAFPEILHTETGTYSHLVTDHFHYWEDGGATYHNRYDSYEFVRGQEGDRWKAMLQPHWERPREMHHPRREEVLRIAIRQLHQHDRSRPSTNVKSPKGPVVSAGRFEHSNKQAAAELCLNRDFGDMGEAKADAGPENQQRAVTDDQAPWRIHGESAAVALKLPAVSLLCPQIANSRQ
jgi:hypothetical protein